MTKMEILEEELKGLGDRACPKCKGEGQIPCPDHMVETVNGWCTCCDTPEVKPQPVNCPCQDCR